jgi:AcrR family transcriptional regulator
MPAKQSPAAQKKSAKVAPVKQDELHSFENAIKRTPPPTSARERILHAAVTLLHEDGFAALTQQRVCARAEVRQSHLTYYFPTRNDLLRETAVYGCEALLTDMVAIAQSGGLTLDMMRNQLFIADESDRRFGRLMTALIVASDEDPTIKPWLANFEIENRKKLLAMFHAAGAMVSLEDIEMVHAAYVGSIILDIGESSKESIQRAQRIVHRAFDLVVQRAMALPEEPRQIRRSKALPTKKTGNASAKTPAKNTGRKAKTQKSS